MNLNEAFKALDSLNEDIFDMSDNGLSGLSDFMNDDIESEDVQIIDPEATTEDELADSYVGKVILDCSVCHSKIYKNKDEVTLDEEGVLANVGEDCPYCYTSDGFKVVGEVVPFNGEGDSDDGETPADGEELPADDDVDEGLLAGDVNVNLDARGFGGSGNDVSVLGSGLPESKEDKLKEGIFDSKATKEKNYKAAIKKEFGKDFVIVAQEIGGLAQTLASHAIDTSATTEQNAKKVQPMLANIESAIKKPKSVDVISTLMNYGRKYADDDDTVEKLKAYFDATVRLRRTEKIGQKAYEYFQAKLADAVLKKLSSFRKYLKKEYGESYDRQVNENIQDLSMTANDTHFEVSEDESGTVTVTASPATADGGEQIAPVSDELEGEITSASEDGEDTTGEDGAGEEDSVDIAIDEVDEGSLDELGEAYLKNVYGNVKSFKTNNVSTCGNKFIVEGIISFNTGKSAKTSFILESHSADRNGNVSFVGGNAHFSNRRNAYTLNGSVVRGKFIAESLDYNYVAVNGKNKVGVKGTATKKVQ